MEKKFKLIDKKKLYSGFFELNKFTFKHKKHDGSWSTPISREIFSGAQVASVLPYDPSSKKFILLDQFRSGLIENHDNPVLKEIVAGIIDKNETPAEAAIRECKEEIESDINKLTKILTYYPAPGSSQSLYHLFLGEVSSFKGERILGEKNENEDILARCYTIEETKKMLNDQKIINGLTLIALQWFFLNHQTNI